MKMMRIVVLFLALAMVTGLQSHADAEDRAMTSGSELSGAFEIGIVSSATEHTVVSGVRMSERPWLLAGSGGRDLTIRGRSRRHGYFRDRYDYDYRHRRFYRGYRPRTRYRTWIWIPGIWSPDGTIEGYWTFRWSPGPRHRYKGPYRCGYRC